MYDHNNQNFFRKYNITSIEVNPNFQTINVGNWQHRYETSRENSVTIKMPMSSWVQLVVDANDTDERELRKIPQVQEAYSKYKMLLELYK